jgi:hypothetical protein
VADDSCERIAWEARFEEQRWPHIEHAPDEHRDKREIRVWVAGGGRGRLRVNPGSRNGVVIDTRCGCGANAKEWENE